MNPFDLAAKAMPTNPQWLNPLFWLVLLVWTLACFGIGALYGAEQVREAAKLEEQGRTVEAIQHVIDANAKVLANEKDLREQDRKRFTTYREEQTRATSETNRLISSLRRDAIRLRVPVRAVCGAAPDGSGPAAAGTGAEGHAELTPDAGEFVVNLLARGDTGIRKHAAVVDLYENLRQKCSAPSTKPTGAPHD